MADHHQEASSYRTDLLMSRTGHILYYVAIIYPLFVILDWYQFPHFRLAALVIRISVSLLMLALVMICKTTWGKPHALSLITVGVLLGQAGFTVLAWHARGLGSSDGDDFSFFFGPFCVLIPASLGWTALVGVAMMCIEIANFAFSGTRIDWYTLIGNMLPFFVVFLSARHAANILETSWRKEFVKRATLEEAVIELRKTQDTLVQAEKMAALGRLTAGVAHELNNPLFVMGTNLSVLEEGADLLTEDSADGPAVRIRSGVRRLRAALLRASLVTQILREFSAPPNRRDEDIDVNEVARLSVSLVTMTSRGRGIVIHQEFGELPSFQGDAQSLSQVFVNLLENACDAVGEEGNVWIQTRQNDKGSIEVCIRDDGPGVPPEHLQKVLEPFFTTKEPGKGMGLGLAVASSVIERHGGSIEFSNGQPGAIVTVNLPSKYRAS